MFKQWWLIICSTVLVWFVASVSAQSDNPSLGNPINQQQLEGFDLIVGAEGVTLPAGRGTAIQGETVFQEKCISCHGADGEGLSENTVLVGGSMQSEGPPLKTVGSFWPYSTTVFDFIRRAMPANAPKSLTDMEVYQVTAYVLYLNGIIERNTVLDSQSLPAIVMPNSNGFVDQSSVHQ